MLLVPALLEASISLGQLRASLSTSRPSPYENELFDLVLTLQATGVRLGQDVELLNLPETNRLEVGTFEELEPQRLLQGTELVEVRRYRSRARALVSGPLSVAPKLRVTLLVRRSVSFFLATWVETAQEIPVERFTLNVRPLPVTGRPADFSGAVGRFSLDVYVAPTNVVVEDLVNVRMEITGTGYRPKSAVPRIASAPYFRIYDPEPVPGRKDAMTFKQILIPQSTNATVVPAVSWTYFDPYTDSYVTLARGPFPMVFQPRSEIQMPRAYIPLQTQRAHSPLARPLLKSKLRLPSAAADLVVKAQKAYEDKQFLVAIAAYQQLLERYPNTAALYCNLGTSYFAREDYGRAILNYRRAQRLSPRDYDTARNLALTIAQSGADGWHKRDEPYPVCAPFTRLLSSREWWTALAAGIGAAGLAFCFRARLRSVPLLTLAALCGIVLLLAASCAAIATNALSAQREAIMLERCTAHLAPATSSLTSFECAPGTRALVRERVHGWARVAVGSKIGWVAERNLALVASENKVSRKKS